MSFQNSVMESTGLESYSMDPDWLDSFLEDPVLNDRMMSDALTDPAHKPIMTSHEHSYSLAKIDQSDCDTMKTETMDHGGKANRIDKIPMPVIINFTCILINSVMQMGAGAYL